MKELLVKRKTFQSFSEMFKINQTLSMIAGPCSIESYKQIELVAQTLVKNNVRFIRGGAYKPRTSPYDFQGLGFEGLKILDIVRKKYNLLAVSEIVDPRDIEYGLQYLDVIQIGSRNMQNYSLLKELGKTSHPVLLKRGMTSDYHEFLLAAEYIASGGNDKIILCERGIKTYCSHVRNMLDIAAVALIKQETSLPVIVDISHSLGRKDICEAILKAVAAVGADGIMLEIHPNPEQALSDKNQQLNLDEFNKIMKSCRQLIK